MQVKISLVREGLRFMSPRPVLIMAGGTGGHVYPALAIAEYLRLHGVPLFWLGTENGLESRVVPQNDITLFTISISGLRGKRLTRWLAAPFTLSRAIFQAMRVLLDTRPSAVIGMGGFVSGPGGIAAWILRIPLYIHEQNSIAGVTNRLLAPLARRVLQAFPHALHGRKVITTGNPVRREIIEQASPPEQRMQGREDLPLRLLVLGGSLGARALNEVVPSLIHNLPSGLKLDVWHQTGQANHEATCALYESAGIDDISRIVPYIEDMASAYNWSDIVLCRAGALTITELSIVGAASILVPFPFAVDDHQTANARYLSEAGAAILVQQPELTVDRLLEILKPFYSDRQRLLKMAIAAQSLARPEATRNIAEICMEAVNVA